MAIHLTLQGVGFDLSNGQLLFSDINFQLQQSLCAIVGPNGAGKSVLGQIIAGTLQPTEGTRSTNVSCTYVPQQWHGQPNDTVSTLLGLDRVLAAQHSIELGSLDPKHYELMAPWWNLNERLHQAASVVGLSSIPCLDRPINALSGGEQFRLLWLAALFKDTDVLIFDEPTNHLDSEGRAQLLQWFGEQKKHIIVISHDRSLLAHVSEIHELSRHGLLHFSGNYESFREQQNHRWHVQNIQLDNARNEAKRVKRRAQINVERQQQQAAKGKINAKRMNLSKMQRDARADNASKTLARTKQVTHDRNLATYHAIEQCLNNREWFDPIGFELPNSKVNSRQRICTIEEYAHPQLTHPALSFNIIGAQHWHLCGANGSGKTQFIKALTGLSQNHYGKVNCHVPVAYLGQSFAQTPKSLSPVQLFIQQENKLTEKDIRDRFAWVRLRNEKADVPFGSLSGGEQLKAMLAIKLLASVTPQLLILDEPSNHLDLDSLNALEKAINQFHGALLLVSHDTVFVDNVDISHRLTIESGDIDELKGL